MATTSSILPLNSRPYLSNAVAAFSVLPALTGVLALVNPQIRLQSLSFPKSTSKRDQNIVNAIIRISAARDLALGLSWLSIWYFGCRNGETIGYKTLGTAVLAGVIMEATDGFVSEDVIGRAQWKHWMFIPVNLGLGLGLLGWI